MTREKVVSRVKELKIFAKDRLEEDAKRALEALEMDERRLAELEEMYRRTACELSQRQSAGGVNQAELGLFSSYLLQIARRITAQREIVKIRQTELESKRQAVFEAYKEQRLFEILHDRIIGGQVREALSAEQKESDERFLLRRQRR